MNSNKPALQALRTQVQFELVQAVADVAQATLVSARAQRRVGISTLRCEAAVRELRATAQRSRINPELLYEIHRMHRVEQQDLRAGQAQLAKAQQQENQVRAVLGELRNRDRSLERALLAERRKEQLKQQTAEMIQADDLWLQHSWMESQ